jgi:hypothetical protein
MVLFLFNTVIYVFLLYVYVCLLWLRLCRTFSSAVRQTARGKPGHGPQSSQFLCCSIYCLFCVVLCIAFVYMCTVLLPPGGYPIAVNKYIIRRKLQSHSCENVTRDANSSNFKSHCFYTSSSGSLSHDRSITPSKASVRSRASCLQFQYLFLSLRPSSSRLRLIPRLNFPFTLPSIRCFRK